jgi:TolB-like protein/predicted Zn-dependent protease
MTAIYIVVAWVAVQVASEAFPALNIPEGAIRYVWVAALIGFPLAVLFSWKYDLTPSGIRRTPAAHEDVAADRSLTRVDYGILVALGLVILATVFGVGQRLIEVQTETGRAPTTREINPNSIAVLPLDNLSPNPDDVYFAAGVHDALITNLSKITALMVTSRTSTLRVNPEFSVPEIGRQLGVAKLLEGSVLMDGDRVRVIVQLIDAASDLHLWAETFEREVTDIIALQNEVARTIAEVIEVRLTPREAAGLDGYAIIAHAPFPGDAYPEAKSAADLALQLDPELAEAHLAVGMYREYYEWDFEGAERALKRAIELNPSLAEAHYHLGWLYELLGPAREEESLEQGERARELDPLSPYMVGWLANQYQDACRYERALSLAKEAIRLDPEAFYGWLTLGGTYADLGQFDEAINAHGHLADHPFWSWSIGTTYAAAGLEDKAREIAAALEKNPGTEFALASIYIQLGDRESALHWIAKLEAVRFPWYPAMLGWVSGSELIANDPQLRARAAALGLPDPRTMGCGA